MKVQDLFTRQKVIHRNITLPITTKTLRYKDVVVMGNFTCSQTQITSLEGAPSHVSGNFACSNTKITSLEGAPSYVGGRFRCYKTDITSLHNVHKHIKHIGLKMVLSYTTTSNIIGVMFIKGLEEIEFIAGSDDQMRVERIISKYLKGDRDVHACQEELIEAGFSEYAKL